ncbi:hypothetical protein C2W62_04725 [Candidatus Entotheonella serta]|nr:hypothetical protein C2W62_04725 [Candidatus Entotheonella serta]
MLLRGSSEHTGDTYDFRSINGEAIESCGIPYAGRLIRFVEAVLDPSADVAPIRQDVANTLGAPALVDSAAVIAIFNAVVRIADATGISLEDYKVDSTAHLRAELGIDDFLATS